MTKAKEKGYSRPLVAAAACLGCAFFGVTMFFWADMLPILGKNIEGVQNLPWILTLGIIAGTIICGAVMDRYGYKFLLVSGSLTLALGLCGFIFFTDLWLLIVSTFLIGAGGGILNSETIAIISDIYGDDLRGTMLSILGASYCIGCLLWTTMCRLFAYSPGVVIKWTAVIIAVLSLLFILIPFPKAKLTKEDKFSLWDSIKLFKYHILAIAGVLFFFQGILEAISATYSTSFYANIEKGIGDQLALTSLIFMTVGMGAGRFTLPLCLKTGGKSFAMYLFMAIALAGSLLQIFLPASFYGAFVSMTLLGFGIGVTAPVVFDCLGRIFKRHSGAAISISIVVAQVGMTIGNLLVGRLFIPSSVESGLFRIFPWIMCAMIIAVSLLFPFVLRSSNSGKYKEMNL
ncbi:MAG: MFS transporter [Bacteroidales bacterium]|nr:MFS transporter [Bacteroidales bacterium]